MSGESVSPCRGRERINYRKGLPIVCIDDSDVIYFTDSGSVDHVNTKKGGDSTFKSQTCREV